ncbi:acyl-CoA carboxylase subunit epsilon [Kineosporia babensis]|uniref:acyl-CoA carboxylase subunit epsilon n=1 Tax=Kineosporia babensis TaxID=499548 RepID=UPI0038B3EF7F
MPEDEGQPVLRVVRGDASAEEIAALLAVLASVGPIEDAGSPDRRASSAWVNRESLVRRPIAPGPGAWRASGWAR